MMSLVLASHTHKDPEDDEFEDENDPQNENTDGPASD